MTPLHGAAIAGAGLAAGTINTIVGSGSLITFPTLLALGYPPVLANVTNTVGLVPGSASGAVGYRRELTGQRRRATALSIVAGAGGLLGGVLLLVLPGSVFRRVVPALILLACGLVLAQPWLARHLLARRAAGGRGTAAVLYAGVFATAVYGGYFGAAQGVLLMALLSILIQDHLQRLNATKNVIAGVVNGVAAVLFIAVAHIAWAVAGLIAVGAITGGQIGATVGRRLPGWALRVIIVGVGLVAAVKLL